VQSLIRHHTMALLSRREIERERNKNTKTNAHSTPLFSRRENEKREIETRKRMHANRTGPLRHNKPCSVSQKDNKN
jgi:hypothetical protein